MTIKKQFEQNNHNLRFMFCVLYLSFLLFFFVYFFLVKLLGYDKIVKNPDILLVDFFFQVSWG